MIFRCIYKTKTGGENNVEQRGDVGIAPYEILLLYSV